MLLLLAPGKQTQAEAEATMVYTVRCSRVRATL